jgi:hypothetical protein
MLRMKFESLAPFHFCLIQDKFVKEFRYLLTRVAPTRITQEVEDFLKGKGVFVHQEDHTYTRLYGYKGIHFLLSTFAYDRYFVAKVCRKYKTWSILFANTTMRSSSHLIEFSEMINTINIKNAEPLEGFDPERLFYEHLESMRYSNIFTRIIEGIVDNDLNTPKKKEKHICNDDLVTKVSFKT